MFGINKTLKKSKILKEKPQLEANIKQENKKKAVVPDLICKSYADGCLVLGCIHDVSGSELIVSLPGIGNFGFVKLNNISSIYTDLLRNESKDHLNPLTQMYNKGNLLRCKVLNYTNKKLNLTIEPNEVNASLTSKNLDENMIISGAVKTKEDHGYTVDLGIEDLNGFYRTSDDLSLGQCCLFKIVSKKSRTISLKLCDESESAFYEVKSRSKFDTYLPGAQLTCTVEKSSKNGIQAIVANQIAAYVHTNHIPSANRVNFSKKTETNSSYSNGDKITGTIIFLNPYSKIIYLSLLPHLNDSTQIAKVASLFLNEEENLKLGQFVEDALITTHTYKGIYVKFKGENDKSVSGFIPKRQLFDKSDTDVKEDDEDEDDETKSTKSQIKKAKKDPGNLNKEELERLFPINTVLKARIYDFSLIEDVILLSIRPTILEAEYMTYAELQVGQIIKCKVRSINPLNGGVNVKLSEFVSGFIPKIHTSDVPLSETLLARKMVPGTELKCKVLQLDSDNKRCVLTAKKTLIKNKLQTIESFTNLQKGAETYGVVVSIQKYGLLLSFYNDLKGLLPRNQMSTSQEVLNESKDLKELYYLGQVIKCKVFELNREKKQLKLSLLMDDTKPVKVKQPEGPDYEIGDLIESATILQTNEESFYFRVRLPRGKTSGIIYKNHLSDLDSLNDILFECYKRSMKLTTLMITQYAGDVTKNQLENNKCHYLTMKTTLIDEYTKSKQSIAKKFSDLHVNDWHHGWIRKILQHGLLVEMPYNLIGFTSNQEVSFLNELKSVPNGLAIGQSVLIKIAKLYSDKNQFITTVRTRHNLLQKNQQESDFMYQLFKSFLTNTKNILQYLQSNTKPQNNGTIHPTSLANKQQWEKAAKIEIGSIVKVVVKQFNKATKQIECLFFNELNETDLTAIAFAVDETVYSPGTKLDALVLAFDPITKTFCLTIDFKQVKCYKKNFDDKFKAQIVCKQDQMIKSEILYVSEWFCIVGLKAHALGRLAFMPLFKNDFTQLNTFKAEATKINTLESKIKKQQLLNVSSAAINTLADDSTDNKVKFNKDDRNFAYYCVGQTGKVCVMSSNEVTNFDYLIVTHDLSDVKKNKKLLLRQLAVLNENHQEMDTAVKKPESNDPIIVRKKLDLNKRKLSAINPDDDKDFIEIVADVKNKKQKLEANNPTEFPWEVTDFDMFNKVINNLNGNDKSEETTETKPVKKNKKENYLDDRKLHEVEDRAFDPNRAPETVDDYERLVVASPNSSYLWIKYMAFYLQSGESEKARNVSQQALNAINYREEAERFNIWIALLNLENLYGSQATIDDTFNKATQNCDSFKVHYHMAEIYSSSSKLQEAEDIYLRMTRKFNNLPETWIKYAIFHYKNSNCESARKILLRSLNSLDKKEHIDIVNKFAQLEFKYGDVERAKTMYDSLLFTYPNRTDIWSVYLDLLIKHQKFDDVRHIFNRIIQLGLTAKRMKFIFKKYMDFEKVHGNEDLCEKVREMAMKYVETSTKKVDDDDNKQSKNSIETNLKKNLFNQKE